jgi:hypothetical protein
MPEGWEVSTDHPWTLPSGVVVYGKKFYRKTKTGTGKVFVQDAPNFHHVYDFGANNDLSHSGSFYGSDEIRTVQDAMRQIDIDAPRFMAK